MCVCFLSLWVRGVSIKPPLILHFLLSFSYAEVRAERRRAFGLEDLSPPEIAPSSVKVTRTHTAQRVTFTRSASNLAHHVEHYSVFQAQELYLDICSTLDAPQDRNSGARSVSSHSSRKSSHTALSDSACESSSAPQSANSLNSRSLFTEILLLCMGGRSVIGDCRQQNNASLVITLCPCVWHFH